MNWYRNLKTAHKLSLGFGICLALAFTLGLSAISRLAFLNQSADRIVSDSVHGTAALVRLAGSVKLFRLWEYRQVLTTDAAKLPEIEKAQADVHAEIDSAVEAYRKSISDPEDRRNLEEFETRWATYLAGHEKVDALADAGKMPEATAQLKANFGIFTQVDEQVVSLSEGKTKRAGRLATEVTARYRQARTEIIGLLVVVLLVGIVATVLTTRYMVGALGAVAAGMHDLRGSCVAHLRSTIDRMSQGDMTAEVEQTTQPLAVDTGDEFGDLARTFNEMLEQMRASVTSYTIARGSLSELLAQTRAASDAIAAASEQVASGNHDLAQRTEEQAASLEETAASMEEMTSTVRHNADNSRQADQLAAQARKVAEEGGAVVGRAVSAMQEVSSGSKKVADIVSVIDEIAFQTNLLALNAAVEAARVGEQGKGFAVVAAEVRSLATRSATAAKEIKALVHDTVSQVEQGTALVNAGGARLTEIVQSIKKVSDVVSEISAASVEQSNGIDQVNKAVMQMDQVTQQNAALVEEATAAAASMKDQSQHLTALVSRFKIADLSAGGASVTVEIDRAIGAHGMWKMRLKQIIDTGQSDTPVETIRKDDQCAFGKWLHDSGAGSIDRTSEAYTTVRDLHAEFHRTAARVAELALSGRKAEAEKLLSADGEYSAVSMTLTEKMMEWKRNPGRTLDRAA